VLFHKEGKLFLMLAPQGSFDENAALLPKEERTSMVFPTSLILLGYSGKKQNSNRSKTALPL